MTKYKLNQWIKHKAYYVRALNLLGHKCNNCNQNDIAVLDFHHLDEESKTNDISILCRTSDWETIEKEIKKCVILCSYCHRRLHFNRKLFDANYSLILDIASGKVKPPSLKRWTTEDTEILIKLYHTRTTILDIANRMGRTKSTITKQIRKLKNNNLLNDRSIVRKTCLKTIKNKGT